MKANDRRQIEDYLPIEATNKGTSSQESFHKGHISKPL